MAKAPKRYMIGYVRVSTQEQADSRLGLGAQEAAIRTEAQRHGWDLTIYRDEGASGKQVNLGLRKALEELSAGLEGRTRRGEAGSSRSQRRSRQPANVLHRPGTLPPVGGQAPPVRSWGPAER